MWKAIERHGEEIVGCFCLAAVAVIIVLEVILRYVFDTGLAWAPEVAGFCMVWMVYMGAALGVKERFHIRIFVGVMALPRRPRLFLVVLSDFIWLVFNVAMLWYSVVFLNSAYHHVNLSPDLRINLFWPQSIVFIGYALITARLVQIYYNWWRAGAQGIPGLPDEYLARAGERGEI